MNSTGSNRITPTYSSPTTRQGAISETNKLLAKALEEDTDRVIQPPPTIHPERYLPELIDATNINATYLSPDRSRQGAMSERCETYGLSVQSIRSDREACDSYAGNHGEEYADRIKTVCINQGVSLGHLHKAGKLRCQPECPFDSASEGDVTDYDVIVGHPTIAYMEEVRENRTVIVQELTGDEFVTTIENPAKGLSPYVRAQTDLRDYHDFIQRRSNISLRAYADKRLSANRIDGERAVEKEGHAHAPLAVFGLRFAEELQNGWETTHQYRETPYGNVPTTFHSGGPNPWAVARVDHHRHRVVRDPGDGPAGDTIHLLQLPDFSVTNGVVGLDIAPVPWVWGACYGTTFTHESVLDPDKIDHFLQTVMDMSVIQTADSHKPYDGTGVTPGRDASVNLWANAEFGRQLVVVSTKNALTDYYPEATSHFLSSDSSLHRQYRGNWGPISQESPVIVANGAPRPPNSEFQMWGAFYGESVPDTPDWKNSFGQIGDRIRHQFMHSRVGRAATNFGANGQGATLVLNTTAIPDWLAESVSNNVDPTNILPSNAHAKREVAQYIRARGQQQEAVTIDSIINQADVSGTTARQATKHFVNEDWIIEHGHSRYSNEYEWNS